MPGRLEAVGISWIATALSQGQTLSEVMETFVVALCSCVEIGVPFSMRRLSLTRAAVVESGGEISLPRRNQGYQTTW